MEKSEKNDIRALIKEQRRSLESAAESLWNDSILCLLLCILSPGSGDLEVHGNFIKAGKMRSRTKGRWKEPGVLFYIGENRFGGRRYGNYGA